MKKIAFVICLCLALLLGAFVRSKLEARFENPKAETAFKPDPDAVKLADAVLSGRVNYLPVLELDSTPWLFPETTDRNVPPGSSYVTTFLLVKHEPVVTQDINGWKITFKP
jgi:hypothetical protein